MPQSREWLLDQTRGEMIERWFSRAVAHTGIRDVDGGLHIAESRTVPGGVTLAVMVPEGVDAAAVIARAYTRYNLSLGAGLSKVAGKLFRIGHVGDLNELMLLAAIAGSEMAMMDLGMNIEPGSGVAAAQTYWRKP